MATECTRVIRCKVKREKLYGHVRKMTWSLFLKVSKAKEGISRQNAGTFAGSRGCDVIVAT